MRLYGVVFTAFLAALFVYGSSDLAGVGRWDSPAHVHVADRYIEGSVSECGALNFVTCILADYRGYDTLGETTVIFTAAVACLLILGVRRDP